MTPTIPVAAQATSSIPGAVQRVEVALTETTIEVTGLISGGPTVLVVTNGAAVERVFAVIGPNGEAMTDAQNGTT